MSKSGPNKGTQFPYFAATSTPGESGMKAKVKNESGRGEVDVIFYHISGD